MLYFNNVCANVVILSVSECHAYRLCKPIKIIMGMGKK